MSWRVSELSQPVLKRILPESRGSGMRESRFCLPPSRNSLHSETYCQVNHTAELTSTSHLQWIEIAIDHIRLHLPVSTEVWSLFLTSLCPLRPFQHCKSLNSRKSFVLGELSFARMHSRHYCLKVNKVHCWNWWPELVNCGQWQPSGVVTQHGMTQILGLPKLLQNLNAPHICWNYTFLKVQNLGPSMLGHHTIWLSLAAMN